MPDPRYNGLLEANPDALVADGLHEAYVGHTAPCPFREPVAVYHVQKCLQTFMDDGLSYEEAVEHFEFNVVGAWMGECTPVFVWID